MLYLGLTKWRIEMENPKFTWFKNFYYFEIDANFYKTPAELEASLAKKAFLPCLPHQRTTSGWVSPLGGSHTALVHTIGSRMLFTFAKEEKLLPASVITRRMQARIREIGRVENRKVSNQEKKILREEVEAELIVKAFSKITYTFLWMDCLNNLLVIDTGASTQAEAVCTLLRKSIGTLPVTLPAVNILPTSVLTEALQEGDISAPFVLGDECELRGQGEDKSVVSFKKHGLYGSAIDELLGEGQMVSQLGLSWEDKISFTLTEDLTLKKVKFLELFNAQVADSNPQAVIEELDIKFALLSEEATQLLNKVTGLFQ